MDRLDKQMQFLLEADKLKNIKRQTYISDGSRQENDAEHSWHLALMSILLSEYANEDVDILKVISMVLIHDIIEIDAGDTYAYDEDANKTKRVRELKAAERLFNILPKDQADYLRKLWNEFEERNTPESRFANTLDRIQPTMLNDAAGGISWAEHEVCASQILKRNSLSAEGSEKLWNYALYRYIGKNVFNGNIMYDRENMNLSRYSLAYERIKSLPDEMNIPEHYRAYFMELCEAFASYDKCIKWVMGNCYAYAGPVYKWYKEVSLDKWKEMNELVNRFRYDKTYYQSSYANPEKAVHEFGKNIGNMFSFLASEVLSLGSYCFELRYFELVTAAELFLEIYNILESHEEKEYEGPVKSAIYYYIYDYMDEVCEYRVRDTLSGDNSFFTDIITNMDMADIRSLYMYGENIGSNEIGSFNHIGSLPEETITAIAKAYTGGYIKSFEELGIDLSKKETVQIRYPIGFERIVKKSIEYFKEAGLSPVILRNGRGKQHIAVSQSGSVDYNPQFAYDHKYDNAIYFNKALKERQLLSLKSAYDKYQKEALVYAGPAVIESFGEEDFYPVIKEEALNLTETQQNLLTSYNTDAANLVNNYIRHDNYSFTIIAFPVPSIGKEYKNIFNETVKINTLDTKMYEEIQQKMADACDKCRYIHIKGTAGNETDLVINLCDITEPDKQTRFHNCLADCNIPVGEIYTSPKLTGTNGLLHVKKVYINGLLYNNLKIVFKDGITKEYSCTNYDETEDNRLYIDNNLMAHHKELPMGEFAIGTNTAAYSMGRKYNISGKLPILIAEKTGPHIAIGDTCFSMSEDILVYNPDGKEVIARENEVSEKRHDNPSEAYFGCHTDITIPYDELGMISAVGYDGSETKIIENGIFVLEGTTALNDISILKN